MRLCQLVIAGSSPRVCGEGRNRRRAADHRHARGRVCFKPVDPGLPDEADHRVRHVGRQLRHRPARASRRRGCARRSRCRQGSPCRRACWRSRRCSTRSPTAPDVKVALVPYETNVKGVALLRHRGAFARPDASLRARGRAPCNPSSATSAISKGRCGSRPRSSSDVVQTEQSNPELLPLTSYRVLLVQRPATPAARPTTSRATGPTTAPRRRVARHRPRCATCSTQQPRRA